MHATDVSWFSMAGIADRFYDNDVVQYFFFHLKTIA